jgi:hypothetical protein
VHRVNSSSRMDTRHDWNFILLDSCTAPLCVNFVTFVHRTQLYALNCMRNLNYTAVLFYIPEVGKCS